LLQARLPELVQAVVHADVAAAQLSKQCSKWLPAAGSTPPGLFERALFRVRMRGGFISGPAYLLRLSFWPTEEDWMDAPGGGSKAPWFSRFRAPAIPLGALNMAAEARLDFFILGSVEPDGAILSPPEARHHPCAAFDVAFSLLPPEPR